MKNTLQYLYEHHTLSLSQAKEALMEIAKGNVNTSQMAAFIGVFMYRSITVDELEGFRDAMLELCDAIDMTEYDPIDLCGTGGDSKDTFNISTLSSIVLAGTGTKVAKHGNYGVSSSIGSSNILEHFGIKFSNDGSKLKKQMDSCNICLLHAPLFHPAMKNVAPIRKELGLKTFFNMLGPLVNPAKPNKQMVGVYSLELARLYQYLYQKSGKQFTIVHTLSGYDEISLTDDIKCISNNYQKIISPEELGFERLKPSDIISGSDINKSSAIFTSVLEDKSTPAQKNVVIANAAMALNTARPELSWEDAKAQIKESIESKKALEIFKKLIH